MIVKKKYQLIFLSLPTGGINLQLVAKLAIKNCRLERGADREADVGPQFGNHCSGECTKGNESRGLISV